MYGIIFSNLLLLCAAISIVWSIVGHKLYKTRIRSIGTIVSFLIAIIGTYVLQSTLLDPTFIKGTLLPWISDTRSPEIAELLTISPTLREVAVGCASALVAPLLFVVLFLIASFLAWIVRLFILAGRGAAIKEKEKEGVPYEAPRTIVWSVVRTLIILVVILLPVSFYGQISTKIADVAIKTDVLPTEQEQLFKDLSDTYIKPISESTSVEIFRAFGGDKLIDSMTSFPIGNETAYLNEEIDSIVLMMEKVLPLTKNTDIKTYGEDEADLLVDLADIFADSEIFPTIVAELLHDATGAWVEDEEFMGTTSDDLYFDDSGMFDDVITQIINIIYTDSADPDLLCTDIKTIAEMASVLIKDGVLSNMDNTDVLFDKLDGSNTIKDVIVILGKNDSMKCLIPEFTNIGIKAIASAIEVKKDANEAYDELMNTIAADLNSAELDGENCVADFSAKLNSALDHAGIALDKDSKQEVLDSCSAALIKLAVDKNAEVTAKDVRNFFATDTSANPLPVQSVEAFEKATLLVFLNDLVIDVDEAAKSINDNNVNQEAEAIGGIFSKAGTLMDDVSGEINIGTMAESVGGILNSLNGSVCVGSERTSNLFIAIVQSSMVRDAANMDIATATDMGTKGSTGDNVDYAKTFKTISNVMDVLENMNSDSEGGMSQEDLTVVLKDLNQQTAGMIGSYITEDRLSQDYGLTEEESTTAAPLLSDVFGYMGSADMTEEECEKEAEALNDVMSLVTNANNKATSGDAEQTKTVFGDPETSVIGKDADGTVETFMASESLKHSLNNNADSLEEDPFGIGDMMVQNDEKDEKQELEEAMKNYYETTEYETEDEKAVDKEALTNLGKLFGFTQEEMDFILGE